MQNPITFHYDPFAEYIPGKIQILAYVLERARWRLAGTSAEVADLPAISVAAAVAQYPDYDEDHDDIPARDAFERTADAETALEAIANMLQADGVLARATTVNRSGCHLAVLAWLPPGENQTGWGIEDLKFTATDYADWATGDCYAWELRHPLTGEHLSSCGGYTGGDESTMAYMYVCARQDARAYAKDFAKSHMLHIRRDRLRQVLAEAKTPTSALAELLAESKAALQRDRAEMAQVLRALRNPTKPTSISME